MRDAIGAVAVAEYKSIIERQLPAYGIGVQIDPWTFANLHVLIVSNLEAETADRNEIIHGTPPLALAGCGKSIVARWKFIGPHV
jgi:hypothetical protein